MLLKNRRMEGCLCNTYEIGVCELEALERWGTEYGARHDIRDWNRHLRTKGWPRNSVCRLGRMGECSTIPGFRAGVLHRGVSHEGGGDMAASSSIHRPGQMLKHASLVSYLLTCLLDSAVESLCCSAIDGLFNNFLTEPL
jgi:hypothetical protein